ncbi:MAG: amidase family protein [Paracoccaceae bacterium]
MSEFWTWTATEMAEAVRSGQVSATELAQAHLDRIDAVNPAINAVVQEFPDEALQEAADVDAARARGDDPGLLAGVPVTIKVNVDQKGHATTNGLTLQKDLIAPQDSPLVANLRKSGAVIVGRTNTPAFSVRWFTDNDLHGQTLNPRNPALTPGGSSGGAGAAVAAGLCAVGHGTDIAGSIRYPAYACGLHGLRPSVGRVPARNASAPDRLIGAQMMAVSGPLARSMDDIELAFHAMSGPDPEDPWSVPVAHDLGAFEKRVALAYAPDGMPVDPAVTAALNTAAEALRAAGWQVEEHEPPSFRKAAELNARLWMAENHVAAREAMEKENNRAALFVSEQMTKGMDDPDLGNLMSALQDRVTAMREWQQFFASTPVLLCPSSGALPFPQMEDLRSEEAFAAVYEAQLPQRAAPSVALPGLNVATGMAGEAPVGVQLLAAPYREDILIAAGRVIEDACGRPQPCTPTLP